MFRGAIVAPRARNPVCSVSMSSHLGRFLIATVPLQQAAKTSARAPADFEAGSFTVAFIDSLDVGHLQGDAPFSLKSLTWLVCSFDSRSFTGFGLGGLRTLLDGFK